MTCDCAGLSLRAEALHRRVAALEDDVAELESENAGLRATVARQREQLLNLASQASRTP